MGCNFKVKLGNISTVGSVADFLYNMGMDTDERKILERTFKLAEENNKILKKIHRSIKWGRFVKLVYWVIIIGSTVGAFYLFQPVFESFQDTFGVFSSGVKELQSVGSSLPDVGGLLEGLRQ